MTDGMLCDDGTLCLDRRCSGLNTTYDSSTCEVTNVEVCGSLAAAGFRSEGEMGCPPGSMCARFQHVEERIMTLYMLNYVDAILELAGAIVTVIYILSNYGGCHKASMFFNRLNV